MIRKGKKKSTFEIDFSKARRVAPKKKGTLMGDIERFFVREPTRVVVDAYAIWQALEEAMDACEEGDVQGRTWLWNDYALFLCRADHDDLREIEGQIKQQLLEKLNEELVRRDARSAPEFIVRILVDEGGEIAQGTGVLRVRRVDSVADIKPEAGEVTVRADRQGPKGSGAAAVGHVTPVGARTDLAGESTRRDGLPGEVRVVSPAGAVALPEGRRRTLGRAAAGAGEDHLALPGADSKVNRRQVAVLVQGSNAEFTREPGANPVEVGGVALDEGMSVTVALPAQIVLSRGAWSGRIERTPESAPGPER